MINLIVNGNSYSYPQPGDKANTGWGSQATNWASAVTAALTALGLGGTLTPTPNAVVDISSTTKGILVPRLTTTQRNAIISPATSLLIFNTTLGVFQYYTGSAWITIGAKIPDNVQFDGTLTVNGNINTNGSITAVGAATAATGNFTDATDATNSTTAPVKTAGGLGIAKKLFVGTDANVGGDANITGKALAGDGLVSAPTYSFINDPDTGLFKIGANTMGFAAGGVLTSQLNSLGVLNGTPGTDFRNLIKRTTGQLTRIASPATNATTNSTSHVSSGVGFAYTPINANSKIVISFICSVQYMYNNVNAGNQAGYIKLYVDTSSVPNMSLAIPGTSTALHNNENIIGYASYPSTFWYINSSLVHNKIDYQNTNLNTKYFYIAFRSTTVDAIIYLLTSTSSSNSIYIVEEYL